MDDEITKKRIHNLKRMIEEVARLKVDSDQWLQRMQRELERHEQEYDQPQSKEGRLRR